MQDISIMYLFHLAWRRIWLIIIAACIFAMTTFAYCKFVVSPRYSAQSTIYVTNGNINMGDSQKDEDSATGLSGTDVSSSIYISYTIIDVLNRSDVYREMANSPEYNGRYDYGKLQGMINVSPSSQDKSMVINISATSTDLDEAIKVSSDFAEFCETYIPEKIDSNIKVASSYDKASNVYPRTYMSTFVAFIVGAAAAFIIAFLVDISDQSIRGEDEFINQYDIPLLGSIPDFDNVLTSTNYKGYYGKASYGHRLKIKLSGKNSEDDYVKTNVLEKKQVPFAIVEAYKNIRTGVAYLLSKDGKNSITITSANAGEGKSTTAANLAVAFSQLGKTVLLIDADLRRASLHKKFKLENKRGLSDILSNNIDFDDAIVTVKPGLDVLTAGIMPPNPSELLDSAKFDKVMEEMTAKYDCVIVDTPPLNVVTDSMLVAPQTGGVILVVRDGYTPHYSIKKAIADMDFSNINILGAIMNGSHPKNKNRYIYRKYSYGYYGSYYKYDYKKNNYGYGYSAKPETENPSETNKS